MISLGPISILRELPLIKPWLFYCGAHLFFRPHRIYKPSAILAIVVNFTIFMSTVPLSKDKLRKHFLEKRNKISFQYANFVSDKISQYSEEISEFFKPSIIAGFYPFRNEINLIPLMKKFIALGNKLCLPITPSKDQNLKFREWSPELELLTGKYGILEPNENSQVLEPDLLLVPLLAYDSYGNRLGYGGGFYDRTLNKLLSNKRKTNSIGVAFKFQKCKKLPIGEYDVPLNSILNEDGIYHFKK